MGETSLQTKLGLTAQRPVVGIDSTEESEYQAFTYGRVGIRSVAMLCLIKSDGFHLALPYIELHAIRTMSPSDGFELEIGTQRIEIQGRNLLPAFRFIREHRLAELCEATRATVMSLPPTDSVVSEIVIRTQVVKNFEIKSQS